MSVGAVCIRALVLATFLLMTSAGGRSLGDDPPRKAPEFKPITPEQSAMIAKGVNWLLRSQNRDGSWGIDAGAGGDITCTSLAALALISSGNTQTCGPSPAAVEAIRKARNYIVGRARRMRGVLESESTTLIQSKLGHHVHTFFATIFLSQMYGMHELSAEELQEIKDILVRAAGRISQTQEADGSWHKNTFGSLKATCMAWLALRSAHSVGVSVEKASVEKVVAFIRRQYNPTSHLFGDGSGGYGGYQTIYATASSLRVLCGMGEGKGMIARHSTQAFIQYVKEDRGGARYLSCEGEDFLAAWMMTQSLLHDEGADWPVWYDYIRGMLSRLQNADGSWTGTACISGRTFATSCSLLTLQSPYRILPMQQF